MNNTDVQALNTDYKPKLHKYDKSDWFITMLEHVALGKIRFCLTVDNKRTKKKSSIISEKALKICPIMIVI